jgi:hypothetical protein
MNGDLILHAGREGRGWTMTMSEETGKMLANHGRRSGIRRLRRLYIAVVAEAAHKNAPRRACHSSLSAARNAGRDGGATQQEEQI